MRAGRRTTDGFESTLREAMVVPEEAVTVAVSLDGVMVPMKDGRRAEKRERSRAAGRRAKGPAGYQEAGCATLSFYDAEGERLDTAVPRAHARGEEGDAEDDAQRRTRHRARADVLTLRSSPSPTGRTTTGAISMRSRPTPPRWSTSTTRPSS